MPAQLGRPSAIFEMLHEARCEDCGTWIPDRLLRFHRETEHSRRPLGQEMTELREIPIPLRIAEYVEAGNSIGASAAACGISRPSVMRWTAIGEALLEEFGPELEIVELPPERRIYAIFVQAIARAKESARLHLLRRIASSDDWRAQAWILERTHPSEFGRVDRVRVGQDPDAGPVRVVQEEPDPSFVADVMRVYEEAGILPPGGVQSAAHNGTNGQNGRQPKKEVPDGD